MKFHRIEFLAACLFVVLSAMALLSYAIFSLYYVTLGLAALFSSFLIYNALNKPCALTFFHAFAISTLFGYILGPFLSIIYYSFQSRNTYGYLAGPFNFDGYQDYLSSALSAALCTVAILYLLASNSKVAPLSFVTNIQITYQSVDHIFTLIISCIVLLAIAGTKIGYMGTKVYEDNQVSVIGQLAYTLTSGSLGVYAIGAANRSEAPSIRIFYSAGLAVVTLLSAAIGRRYFMVSVFVSLLIVIARFSRFAGFFSIYRLAREPKTILIVMLIAGVIICGNIFFYALRIAGNSEHALQKERNINISLFERIPETIRILKYGDSDFYEQTRANSGSRSGTLPGYLGQLLNTDMGGNMRGQCFLYGMITSMPRLFFVSKNEIIEQHSCDDKYVNSLYALPVIDSPTTLLTYGYQDFRYLGLFGYIIMFALLYQGLALIVPASHFIAYKVIALSILFNSAFAVEASIGLYFVGIRDLFLLWVIASLVAMISRFRI